MSHRMHERNDIMAKAKKLKSGSWRCLVYDYTDASGKRHYKSLPVTIRLQKAKEWQN